MAAKAGLRLLIGLGVLTVFLTVGAGGAMAVDVQHGIGFTKGCTSPTKVGDPYSCTFTVRNILDEAEDTLTITQIVDTVHAAAPFGNQTFSTILDDSAVAVFNGASCTAPPNRVCTIPFGGRVVIGPFSHYTVHPTDFTGANPLGDDANLTWHDLCNDPAGTGNSNCVPNPPTNGAGSQANLIRRASQTATTIHNAAHGPVTVVESGSIVHDFVSVTTNDPSPLNPIPSGNVTVDWFLTDQCSGGPQSTSAPIPLGAGGTVDATSFPQGPLAPGLYGFKAHYAGDSTYLPSDGVCEPLRVVDANIQLTPATATNAVGTNHVLTCHINVNDGTGPVNAPAGTVCTVSIISGPGTPATQNCTVSGGGSCTVTITSAATGTSVLRASTNVTVAGLVLHRETGDGLPGDGPNAQKVWVDANIQISPPTATNAVGTNHVLTITVNALNGTIDAGPHTATASIVSGPGSFVGSPSCTYTGGAATASCTVTITSSATGTTVVQATSNIPVNGQTISRTTATNPGPGGSGNASKVWVDANIAITPATANNPVGTNHVLTITVNALNGTIDPGPHTATASIVSGPGSFVGSPSCTYTGGAATASCTVTITSATTGTTVVSATSDIPVSGQTITRTTGTAANTASGGSGNASKNWADSTVRTDIHNAGHTVITSANAGDVVHDKVFVAKAAGTSASVPDPSGNVTFRTYTGLGCTGGATSSQTVALAADGTAESATTTVTADMSYQAEYAGDANYPGHTGACEPLQVKATLPCPAGSFTYHMEANGDLTIVYDQFPAPNDNSYGVNAVGWGTKGHTFGNLVGSDHAGFSLIDPSNTTKLDFNIDYISQVAGTPSGYASLGPFGGDGKVNVGTLTPADIAFDTSEARNLNNTGYFAGGVQVVGNAVANLLVDSPPTLNTTDSYTLSPAAAAVFTAPNFDSADTQGWNFHDTYFVTVKAAKLAALGFNPSTWKVAPNADELHNSPAKPCPCVDQQDPNPTLATHDNGNGTTTFTFTQSLAVNDNSYGTGTDPSWAGKTHKFSDLTGSDKAEFVLTNGNGQKVLDVFVDYLSAKVGAPSGYGSLGPFGGDGSVVSGDTSKIVSFTTSIDDDMNVLCAAGTWTINSPTSPGKPECAAWNFTNSYTLTVNNSLFGASGLGTFSVPAVHNSPSKPLTCPGAATPTLSVTSKKVDKKQVQITIKNSGNADAFLTALQLSWPQAVNGNLVQIKLDGDVLYNNATGVPSPASLGVPPLVTDQNKRKIGKHSSDNLILIFKNNASTNLSLYSGTASFGATNVTILP